MTKLADNVAEAFRLCNEQTRTIADQSAKLARAMVIVTEVLDALDPHHECFLCDPSHPDDGGDWEHAEDCPLVVGGFCDKEGNRLP